MKVIKSQRLYQQHSRHIQVYEIELVQLAGESASSATEPANYLVNWRSGRRGQSLRSGSKTPQPVSLQQAEQVFASVELARLEQGYSLDLSQLETTLEQAGVQQSTDQAARAEYLKRQLIKLDQNNAETAKRRSRIIWRLAELNDASALPLICQHIGEGYWLQDYCIAWAIGQLGDARQLNELHRLRASEKTPVSTIAFEAQLKLADPDEINSLLQPILDALPEPLQKLIYQENDEATALNHYLSTWLQQSDQDQNRNLRHLYLLAISYPPVHQALAKCLLSVPFKPGYFQGLRYLFNASEFRRDGLIFGLLTRRLDTSAAFFNNDWDWAFIPGEGSVKASTELKKSDSRLAYSSKTRQYMRLRSWRVLRRLGTAGNPAYVDFAAGILQAMDDSLAQKPRQSQVTRWEQQANGRYQQVVVAHNRYDEYAGFMAFNHILYEHDSRYQLAKSRRAWLSQATDNSNPVTQRTEAFAKLWDQQPQPLLQLLCSNRCEPVLAFASKALINNSTFCQQLDNRQLSLLLTNSYPAVSQFALAVVRQRLEQGSITTSLLLALLASDLSEARHLAMDLLADNRENLNADHALVSGLLFISHGDVQQWFTNVQTDLSYNEAAAEALLTAIIQQGLAKTHKTAVATETTTLVIARQVLAFIKQHLLTATKTLPMTSIQDLLETGDKAMQWLAGQLLLLNPIAFEQIPALVSQLISSSEFSEVRAISIALLSKQTDEQLLQQPEQLFNLFIEGETAERQAVAPLIERLANNQNDFAQQTFTALLPLAFRSEQRDGQQADLIELICVRLQNCWYHIDKDQLWRLLQAKAKCAQTIGGMVLQSQSTDSQEKPSIFSVKQWVQLGKHAQVNVRHWVFACYQQQTELIKQQLNSAFGLFNSPWEDSRHFARDYFQQHLAHQDWSPALIIDLCDNQWPDVQDFGRHILQTRVPEADRMAYLIQLSEHPSLQMQTFVSDYLQQQLADQSDNIIKMQPFFATVLGQVNKNRLSKDRVMGFLTEQAITHPELAATVASIFTRYSATVVKRDKAQLLQAMVKLKKQYPMLDLPIQAVDPVFSHSH